MQQKFKLASVTKRYYTSLKSLWQQTSKHFNIDVTNSHSKIPEKNTCNTADPQSLKSEWKFWVDSLEAILHSDLSSK